MNREKLDQYIRGLTQQGEFSGVVLVKQGEEDLFANAYGYASMKWKIVNTIDTIFPHASVTKMFTAVAALQVVEEGMLSLESKVQNILKLNVSNVPSNVTLHHLLTHTSGIADYFDEYDDDVDGYAELWNRNPNYAFKNLSDFLALFAGKDPLFNAGNDFRYCNAGYVLIGLMIEKATGIDYFEYVKRNVFIRAGMEKAGFIPFDAVRDNVAEGHQPIKNKEGRAVGWKKNVYSLPVRGSSDGGAYSTARDLVRFLRSLREGQLLSGELTTRILQPQGPIQEDPNGDWAYGYGLAFLFDKGEVVRYGHGGDDPGVSAKVFYYPGYDIDVVILGNQSHCADPVAAKIHQMIVSDG